MKKAIVFVVCGMALALGLRLSAQETPLLLPAALEKELAAKASDVTEVTLDKKMLGFATKFMNSKKGEDEDARQLIEGLNGIYVREYEFEKEGEYPVDVVQQLRQGYSGSEWSSVVRERSKKESTDVLVRLVNGQPHGLFILEAEPKELTIVLIDGPIRMEDLGKLKGISGLEGISGVGSEAARKKGGEK